MPAAVAVQPGDASGAGHCRRGLVHVPAGPALHRRLTKKGTGLMPMQINKGVIGKEAPPFVVTVERGKIKEFARAIGDDNPLYLDDLVGQASEWGDVIAPPTFMTTFRDGADSPPFLRELGTDISRLLHGEQEFELHRPIRPGETFTCRSRVLDVYEKTGRSGPMAFVLRQTTVTDTPDEIVATIRHTTVIRL